MAAGGETCGGVCRRGHRIQTAGWGLRPVRLWPGLRRGRGWVVCGRHRWCSGGAGLGVALVGSLGVPLGCVGAACACSTVLVVPDWWGAEVWVGGGRMGIRAGLWSVGSGWLPVDCACWYGVWVGGLLVVVGWFY